MQFITPANNNELLKNMVLSFMLDKSGIRGRFVRLGGEVHKILTGHRYPAGVSQLLGELLVLVAMIGSMLKLKGLISVQVQGSGDIGFMCADYTSEGNLRGYTHMNNKKRLQEMELKARNGHDITELFGKGHVVITIEQPNEQPYQAIVPLEGNSLTECITGFFHRSEQLEVVLEVAVNKINKKWCAGGLVVQRIPEEGGKKSKLAKKQDEDWNRAGILLKSVTDKEIIDSKLSPNDLLFRLFNEDGVKVFEPKKLQAKCRCSRERMLNALASISKDELESMKVKGKISMNCQFCNRTEVFDDL